VTATEAASWGSGGAAWDGALRLKALRRFGMAITLLNVFGHSVLGFEASWAYPLVSLATTYSLELIIEVLESWALDRRPRFLGGGVSRFIDYLLPAHITGLAVSMLLYANEQLWAIAFAAAVAIGSKALLRLPLDGKPRHFLNPSNAGISATLALFAWVGIAPPYQFTEGLHGAWDWALPAIIACTGTMVNGLFTRRLPLIAGWLAGFVAQASLRSLAHDTPLAAALAPMTGVTFVLYTFYMVTDPATTPRQPAGQLAFGASVAAAYGLLVEAHVVFDLFFSLSAVCLGRGLLLWARDALSRRAAPRPAVVASPGGPAA
jgi:hypothetical protein